MICAFKSGQCNDLRRNSRSQESIDKYQLYFDKGPLYQHLHDTSTWKSLVSNLINCFAQKVEKFLRIFHCRVLTKIRVQSIQPRIIQLTVYLRSIRKAIKNIYDSLCIGFIKNLLCPGRIDIVIRSVRFCNISHEIRGFIYFLVKEKITHTLSYHNLLLLEKTPFKSKYSRSCSSMYLCVAMVTYPPPE